MMFFIFYYDVKKNKAMQKITEKKLEKIAIHYLARFACSTNTLRYFLMSKLQKIECTADNTNYIQLVDIILQKLQKLGLLDDLNYGEHVMHSLIDKGKSKQYIIYNMKKKGIPDNIINQLTFKIPAEEVLAMTFAKKKCIGPFRNCSVHNIKEQNTKDIKTMLRQGFSLNVIYKIFNQCN